MHRNPTRLLLAASVAASFALGGCSRDLSTLEPAKYPTTAPVFDEGFAANVGFQAFGGSKVTALSIDSTVRHSGASSIKISVPAPGDPAGGYAGGAFVDRIGRDLSGFTALTFWARSSVPATLNTGGVGNDNTGNSRFTAETGSLTLTPTWKKYIIPLPDPSRLDQERGLFYFAEGPENGAGYDIWFDEAKFENIPVGTPQPAIPASSRTVAVGQTLNITGTTTSYTIDGATVTLAVSPKYFTFASSNTAVATVGANGTISVVGIGTTNITAKLGTVNAAGTVTLTASNDPTTPAPAPTRLAADVISLYSNTYTNRVVDTWSAGFDQADVTDIQIAGNDTKKYTSLVFAGIEFISQKVNATSMTGFHLDVLLSDAATFRVKLVDFGANGAFGGGDDTEHEVTLTPGSTPGLVAGTWNSLDLPFTLFPGLTSRANLAQLIISGSSSTVYLDNVYFYRTAGGGTPTSPTTAAPAPTAPAGQVTSMFSDTYTNVAVDTWSAGYDQADVADTAIAGNNIKKYTNLVFAGIEATTTPIDATARQRFHMDIWTPNTTASPAVFRVKLVDFGANGTFAGGDDVEHELTFTAATTPALATGQWVAIDVPLSDFTGLTTRAHIAQLIISSVGVGTVYIDNVYFSGAPGSSPTVAAPAPTTPAGQVTSMFSDTYTNVAVDTWSAGYDQADVADTAIAGNNIKKYTNLVFAGIEATTTPIDATARARFHMDIWTPNATAAPAVFRVKLVDFGANGGYGGGDDVEHELTFDATTTPALATGQWISIDVPLTAFTGLVTRAHIAQLIISSVGVGTVYVDNVYFRN